MASLSLVENLDRPVREYIERQIDDGLLGSGIGAKWQQVPVPAEIEVGPGGEQSLLIDHAQLERAVGAEAAARAREMAGSAMAKRL